MPEIVLCLGKDYAGTPRPEKGKSRLDLIDDYVVIDIETTGLDSRFDDIIELAAVRVSNAQITDKFQSLVKPGQPIPPYITDLTGISDQMVAGASLLESTLPQFLSFVGDSIVVAHNANFDINFIYDFARLLDLPPFSNDFIDTLRLSRRLFPQWDNHKLGTLTQELNIPRAEEHRALSDCIQASRCYEAMKAYAKEHNVVLRQSLRKSYGALSKSISPQSNNFNPDSPLYGKTFVFTGALDGMTRREAMQRVIDFGGFCADSVTKGTDFLVLGSTDYCSSLKGGKSNKQKKAEKMKRDGFEIEVISENVFYDMLADASSDAETAEATADAEK